MHNSINNEHFQPIFEITLRPMRWLMYIFGALPYEFEHVQNCSRLILLWRLMHLTLISAFVIWISILRFLRFHEVLYKKSDFFSNGMDISSYLTLILLHSVVYWENTWKAYQYKIIFENFESLRNKFSRELKTSIDIGRIRLFAFLLYTLLAMYIIIMFFIVFIRYIKALNGFRLFLLQYGDTILKLKLIEFMIFAAIVMALQIELNSYLLRYTGEIEKNQIFELRTKKTICEEIYMLQEIHNILIMNVRCIEKYCNWSLPGLMLKMFFEFTITAYWIYFSFDYKISALFQSYGFCVALLNLIFLFVGCSICSKCAKLDKAISNKFHTITHKRYDRFFNDCLNEISLHLLHQKLFFTAGGFVDINYMFFGRVCCPS